MLGVGLAWLHLLADIDGDREEEEEEEGPPLPGEAGHEEGLSDWLLTGVG